MFQNGGYAGVYDLPSNRSWYYPLYKKVMEEILNTTCKQILEVGCGTGSFAEIACNKGYSYAGFDFSEVAVKKARLRCGNSAMFYQGDALDKSSYKTAHDIIVCTEVLEHIEKDIEVIALFKKGVHVICTVPNYDSPGQHVRYFTTQDQVFNRYKQVIALERIEKLKKPVLPDISWTNYLRHIKWNRYNFSKLKNIFGWGAFETVGGWFTQVSRKCVTPPCAVGPRRLNLRWICDHGSK